MLQPHLLTRFFDMAARGVSAGAFSALMAMPLLSNAQQMTTAGQFAVSPSGAATYTIPIQVPPGVAGMQPQLALSYNSQAGNGLLGQGWNLSGLSAITRCPRTMAQDGVRGSVNFDANDRFCLDGQRLIVTVGVDGAAGSEYRTEMESFSRIKYDGNGFTVESKAGLTTQYGMTTDSRIEAQGKTVVRLWAINKVSDVVGNSMRYAYMEDSNVGDFRITQIDYTANDRTGAAASNSVRFEYESRSDAVPMYQMGSKLVMVQRLKRVVTTVQGNVAKFWDLTYDGTNPISKLLSVAECSAGGVCLPPVMVSWLSGQKGATNIGAIPSDSNTNWDAFADRTRVVDLNGDGLPDVLIGPDTSGNWYVLKNTGASLVNQGAWATGLYGDWAGSANKIRLADMNGDGLVDVLMGPDGSGNWFVLKNTGTNFVDGGPWISGAYGNWSNAADRIRTADLNGDGLPDVLIGPDNSGSWYVLKNSGAGFVNEGAWLTGAFGGWDGAANRIRLADMNGDGLVDVLIGPDDAGNWYVLKNTGSSFLNTTPWIRGAYGNWDGSADFIRVADLNGDGLPDVLIGPDGSGSWYVLKNTGSELLNEKAWITGAYANWSGSANRIRLADMDGDGLTDVLMGPDSSGNWFVLKNSGSNFSDAKEWAMGAYGNWAGSPSKINLADMNGDGATDVLIGPDSTGKWSELKNNNQALLVSSVGPAGQAVTFNYGRAETSNWQAGSYPRINVRTLSNAVISTQTSNGAGGFASNSYTYGSPVIEVGTGRGMLGVKSFKSREGATGVEIYTEYSQSWPYAGLPVKTETYHNPGCIQSGSTSPCSQSTGKLLKRTQTVYACKKGDGTDCATVPVNCNASGSAVVCTDISKARVMPYAATVTEQSWDLTGAVMPTIVTMTNYNKGSDVLYWGDVSSVDIQTTDGVSSSRKTIANDYFPASTGPGKWIAGRLKRSAVTSTLTTR